MEEHELLSQMNVSKAVTQMAIPRAIYRTTICQYELSANNRPCSFSDCYFCFAPRIASDTAALYIRCCLCLYGVIYGQSLTDLITIILSIIFCRKVKKSISLHDIQT